MITDPSVRVATEDFRQEGEAGIGAKPQIEEDYVEGRAVERLERRGTRPNAQDMRRGRLQAQSERLTDAPVVIDDKADQDSGLIPRGGG